MSRCVEPAGRFGFPVYVYDREALVRGVRSSVAACRPGIELLYSLKANPLLGLCRVLAGLNLGAETASLGELRTALAAGFGPDRIQLGGPN